MKEELFFHFQKADEAPGFLLWRVYNLWQRQIKRQLRPLELTHTQFVVLATAYWLSLQREEVTQIDIARESKTDVMLTSNVLRALEKRQLLERREHSSDTRAKAVLLTKAGVSLLKKAVKRVEDFDRSFFDRVKDKACFKAELNRLMQ